MGEDRQIFCVQELQVIHVDTLPWRREAYLPTPQVWATQRDCLPRRTAQKGGGETVEKPDKHRLRTPLVVRWLRIHLPMPGTRVRALVREDPTYGGATKHVCHNY